MVKEYNIRAKRIFCIVAYDIKNDLKRARVSKTLEKYGTRVNYSVFECIFTKTQFLKVQEMLAKQIRKKDDSLIFYPVCVNCYTKIVYCSKREKVPRIVQIV